MQGLHLVKSHWPDFQECDYGGGSPGSGSALLSWILRFLPCFSPTAEAQERTHHPCAHIKPSLPSLPTPPLQQKLQSSCAFVAFSLETISLSWIIQCEGHNERPWIFLILVHCDLSFQGFTYRRKAKSVFQNSRNTV